MAIINVLGTNILDPIDNKMQDIIDTFVEYYGEKYRDRFTQKLNNAFYIFAAQTHSDFSVYERFNSSLEIMLNDYTKKLLKSCGAINTEEIDYKDLLEIIKTKSFDDTNKKLYLKMIKCFRENSTNKSEKLLKYEQIKNEIQLYALNLKKEFNKKYKNIFTQIARAKTKVKRIEKHLKNKKNKYKKIVDDFLLNEIESIRIINKKTGDENLEKYIDTLRNLYTIGEEGFLNNCESSFLNKQYIKFFKVLGFDCGNTIEDYKNNFVFKATLFDRQSIEDFKKLVKQSERKLIFSSPFFYNAIEKIRYINTQRNLKPKYIRKVYKFICSNDIAFVKTHPGDSKQAVCCVCRDYFHASDEDIIHEMNHIIETDHIKIDGVYDEYKCGFSYSGYYGEAVDEIEMLNEVVNEYFSSQIAGVLHKNNVKLVVGKNITSLYSFGFPFVKNFIEENREDIITARMSEKPYEFQNKFGKKKFVKLAIIVNKSVELVCNSTTEKEIYDEINKKYGKFEDLTKDYKAILEKEIEWSDKTKEYLSLFEQLDNVLSNKDAENDTKPLNEENEKLKKLVESFEE